MNKFRTIAVIAAFAAGVITDVTVKAQSNKRMPLEGSKSIHHELSFGGTAAANGILQTFDKKVKSYLNAGGGLQINYTLHFNQNVSLVFGVAAKYCQSMYGFDMLDENDIQKWLPPIVSIEDKFLFNAEVRDYNETHNALYIQIPLLFGYETSDPLLRWYVNIGAAAQFTAHGNYEARISRLTTYGYSEDYEGELKNIPYLGFGTVEDIKVNGKPALKFTVNGYAETGMKISIGKSSWLYIGVFGEMSMLKNSIAKAEGSGREHLINYTWKQESNKVIDHLNVTSITNTKYSAGGRTYALGGIIRIGFDFHTSKRMLSVPLR
jgi:hypothetical protein